MRLSTKVRYGARFMLDLAIHDGEGPIPLNDIAQRQRISEKYLWNLIVPLKTAGLIKSVRGSSGGFVIGKSLDQISLKGIANILEGSLCLVECVDDPKVCRISSTCVTREIWGEVSASIEKKLESITLKNMVERYKKGSVETESIKYFEI